MIALDTSAVIAIVLDEPDASIFSDRIDGAGEILIGTPTKLEARLVLTRRIGAPASEQALAMLLGAPAIRAIDFTMAHLDAATDAFLRYGKGGTQPL